MAINICWSHCIDVLYSIIFCLFVSCTSRLCYFWTVYLVERLQL